MMISSMQAFGSAKIGNSSLTFDIKIVSEKKETVLAKGTVVWVHVDQQQKTSAALPKDLAQDIAAFERH